MGQAIGAFWDRAQGKWQVRRICDKFFDQWPRKDKNCLAFQDLYTVTLMVYNSINKQLFSPYKEPPTMEEVQGKINALIVDGKTVIDREDFHRMIMAWIEKDLRMVLANRVALALLAAPFLAVQTKSAGRRIPRVGTAVDRVPTPLLTSAYSVGLVFLQDMRVD